MAARIKSHVKNHDNAGFNSTLYSELQLGSTTNNKIQTNFEALDHLSRHMIARLDQEDLDIGMTILNNLMSNPKKDVIAYSLGKLYIIFEDEKIRKMIIEELRDMKLEEDQKLQKYVEKSIESIAEEINNIEIFKMECNIFDNIYNKFEFYLNMIINRIPQKFDDKFVARIQKSRIALQLDDMIYSLEELMKQLENGVELHWDENGAFDHYNQKITRVTLDNNNFNHLVDVYALTFREHGHVDHLVSLLNDESPVVRMMGVDSLLYVLKVLTEYHEHLPYEGTMNTIINSFKNVPKLRESFRSKIHLKKNSK